MGDELGCCAFAHQSIELLWADFLLFDCYLFLGDGSELGVGYSVDEVLLRAVVLEHVLSVACQYVIGHARHAVHSELVLGNHEGKLLHVLFFDLHASSFEHLRLDAVEGDIIEDLGKVTVEFVFLDVLVASDEDTLEQGFVVGNFPSLLQQKSTEIPRCEHH